jgi:tetratricopeptide (TPR) repeat protein
MKRIIALAGIMIMACLLFAQAHDNSEYEMYSQYQENPSAENFTRAYEKYSSQEDETSRLLLAYLHYSELENQLAYMEENQDSLSMKTRFNFANLLLDLGRYDQCIIVYDKLNETSPQWACPWRHKGEAFWKMGDLSKAEQALEKSIEVRKNHYDAYVMLAEVQREAGKPELALKTLEEGFKYRDENPEYSQDAEFEENVRKLQKDLQEELKIKNQATEPPK